ncbi:MAG: tRNA lysidine(34) synthetase TilS [Rhodospirillaceae bacterium]|nr:tRNA lysidine(34) synthetase TilS [Rhodospirillaceae bacterium]
MSSAGSAGNGRSLAAGPEPLKAAEFAALIQPFCPFEPTPHCAVAVSGGRDSLCLLRLTQRWATSRGGRVTALIVDHGLRSESARDAEKTVKLAKGFGAEAVVLKANGTVCGNQQDWARRARYRLLTRWCASHFVLHLFIAHHRDDQAETVLANRERGIDARSLSGMAAVRHDPACRIIRPLLGISRDRLTATLGAAQIPWIDDPSNQDRRFRRVRLREVLDASGKRRQVAVAAMEAGKARHINERQLADFMATTVRLDRRGVSLSPDDLTAASPALAADVMASVIRAVGWSTRPLRTAPLTALVASLRSPRDTGIRRLGGCTITWNGTDVQVEATPDPRVRRSTYPIPLASAAFYPFSVS